MNINAYDYQITTFANECIGVTFLTTFQIMNVVKEQLESKQ